MTDYISRDGFVKWVEETYCKPCEERKQDYNHCRCGSCQYDDMMRDVEGFPAADVRPVVRGHWITEEEAEKMGDYLRGDTCSVCGHCDWDCTESSSFNFCPFCGSDMRQEVQE